MKCQLHVQCVPGDDIGMNPIEPHITEHDDPLEALRALAHDTKADLRFKYLSASCYLECGGTWIRQWHLNID